MENVYKRIIATVIAVYFDKGSTITAQGFKGFKGVLGGSRRGGVF